MCEPCFAHRRPGRFTRKIEITKAVSGANGIASKARPWCFIRENIIASIPAARGMERNMALKPQPPSTRSDPGATIEHLMDPPCLKESPAKSSGRATAALSSVQMVIADSWSITLGISRTLCGACASIQSSGQRTAPKWTAQASTRAHFERQAASYNSASPWVACSVRNIAA